MIDAIRLRRSGLDESEATALAKCVEAGLEADGPTTCWGQIIESVGEKRWPFEVYDALHEEIFRSWDEQGGPAPVWVPDGQTMRSCHLRELMDQLGVDDYANVHRCSVTERSKFWDIVIRSLDIQFHQPADCVLADSADVTAPNWLVGARLNIVDSCFGAPDDATAMIHGGRFGSLAHISYGQMRAMANRVSNGLIEAGFEPSDAIAIDMPMLAQSVPIYLGIVQAGCVVVGIADSFAAPEIAERLKISKAKGIFTCGHIERGGKRLPMYEKIMAAEAPPAIVVDEPNNGGMSLRPGDQLWEDFLSTNDRFDSHICSPHDPVNVLFSSGTTAEPKAIVWDHTTPIRCGTDGRYHHDIQPKNVVAWPTSLGWMMGPWLIFATLMNRGTIALYQDAPIDEHFGRFVQNAKVNMLGVVPSLVNRWRQTRCMERFDWSRIRAFSSTGECSNPQDMLYLMYLAGFKPIIEYCGGTEIGGGYVTSTLVQPNAPSTFSTAALGHEMIILDEHGEPAQTGEVFLSPPSIGLSRRLLNRDHDQVYYAGTPQGPEGQTLRRHGDEIQRMAGGYYRALGRADDTMNLGGIKISSAQIERTLVEIDGVKETAAIAVSPAGGGPGQLVIYAVLQDDASVTADHLKPLMQDAIRTRLNPLFRVSDVVIVDALPRTASQKVMRRELRARYEAQP